MTLNNFFLCIIGKSKNKIFLSFEAKNAFIVFFRENKGKKFHDLNRGQ